MRWWWLVGAVMLGACQRPCGPSTCDGCCISETECVEGTARLECGSEGAACTRCTSEERCQSRRCQPAPVVDAGVADAGAPVCRCFTSCCLPDGSCAPNNSIDACGPANQRCGTCAADQRCEAGACVAASCAGCLDPLGRCLAGNEVDACGASGGVCVTCSADQACVAGQCVFTRCDLSNCRFGCCQPDKRCVAPTVAACGIGGVACEVCDPGRQCLGGTCQ